METVKEIKATSTSDKKGAPKKSTAKKKVVTKLKESGAQQAEVLSKDHRPWGWFNAIAAIKINTEKKPASRS